MKALGSTAPIALLLSRPSWFYVGREETDSRPIKAKRTYQNRMDREPVCYRWGRPMAQRMGLQSQVGRQGGPA